MKQKALEMSEANYILNIPLINVEISCSLKNRYAYKEKDPDDF